MKKIRRNFTLILLPLLFLGWLPDDKYDPTTLVFPTKMHIPVRKATGFHLFLFVQNRVKVNDPQGIAVARLDSWENPRDEKDDDEITVYGVNSGENVIIFNTSMTSIGFYGLNEKGDRRLNRPRGISAARWGDVYVADTGNNRVVHLFNPGRELKFVRTVTVDGMAAPAAVALCADSTLYVSDTGHNRLLRFRDDRLARVIAEAGQAAGQVWQPTGVAATSARDRWSFYKDAFVVVVDLLGKRLQKFLPDGTFVRSIRSQDFGYEDADLQYVTIDYYSQVWVTDKKNHCVHKFDRNLNYLTSFGRKGTGDKEFVEPRGISVYKRFGQMLIAEKEAAQYYWIGTDVKDLRASKDELGLLQIEYFLTEPSFVTLEIFAGDGNLVATPQKESKRPTGATIERYGGNWQVAPYTLRDDARVYDPKIMSTLRPIPPGEYRLRFTFSATYSSYKYFTKSAELRVKF